MLLPDMVGKMDFPGHAAAGHWDLLVFLGMSCSQSTGDVEYGHVMCPL